MEMLFRTYTPQKLNNLVVSIYERKALRPAKMQFLPDGTVTLIFNIGNSATQVKGKNVDSTQSNPIENFCFLSGLHTQPLYFHFDGLHVLGLILRPLAMRAFFSIPTKEITDQAFEGTFIRELNYIEDQLRSLNEFNKRVDWLENFFLNKLKQATDLDLAFKLQQTVGIMKRDVFSGQRLELDKYSGYSKMHTNRIFKEWLGLAPGKVMRYQQFLHAVELIHNTDLSLTHIAYDCGFFDQAHFTRVFKEFANITPGQYRKRKTHMKGIMFW